MNIKAVILSVGTHFNLLKFFYYKTQGELEVQFVSPGGEAGIHTGDLCQMVESIAFFEAYRPVLEGLKTITPGEFPFPVIIIVSG